MTACPASRKHRFNDQAERKYIVCLSPEPIPLLSFFSQLAKVALPQRSSSSVCHVLLRVRVATIPQRNAANRIGGGGPQGQTWVNINAQRPQLGDAPRVCEWRAEMSAVRKLVGCSPPSWDALDVSPVSQAHEKVILYSGKGHGIDGGGKQVLPGRFLGVAVAYRLAYRGA